MTHKSLDNSRNLDPYLASSLLQKTIRRGDTELALRAAHSLLASRGKNVWRRLLVIAFEDIGIGDLDAVRTTLEIAEVQLSRSSISLSDGLENAVSVLASSTKNRGTDHLTCAAIRHQASAKGSAPALFEVGALLDAVSDPSIPVVERAANLLDCAVPASPGGLKELGLRLDWMTATLSGAPLEALRLSMAGLRLLRGSFVATLPLLAAELEEVRHAQSIVMEDPPEPDWLDGIPSYAFDKHTSVGKRAMAKALRTSDQLQSVLESFAQPNRHLDVLCMAAFHTDAVPVDRKLVWPGAEQLERAGLEADMLKAGCPPCGVDPIMTAVASNLDQINSARADLYGGRKPGQR